MPIPALVILLVSILGFFFFIGPIGSLIHFDFLSSGLAGWERAFAAVFGSLAFYYAIQYFAPENLGVREMRVGPLVILTVLGVAAYYFAVTGHFSVVGVAGSSTSMIDPLEFIFGAGLAAATVIAFVYRKRIGFK